MKKSHAALTALVTTTIALVISASSLASTSLNADSVDVYAVISSDEEAQQVCPPTCRSLGYTWNGTWRMFSGPGGSVSVCACK